LDPNFQYWGKVLTNEKGEYGFKTIKPGSYPVSRFWTRPPHLHFTVNSRGHSQLITQMYFAGESFNKKDRLLREHSPVEQAQCIVSFRKIKNTPMGQFNLGLLLEKTDDRRLRSPAPFHSGWEVCPLHILLAEGMTSFKLIPLVIPCFGEISLLFLSIYFLIPSFFLHAVCFL
jgi:hypothetical protein